MSSLGRPHLHVRLTDSTNERAKELAREGAPHGTLVTADEQSAGRGRQGRSWSAPAGSGVLMSLVVRDPSEILPLAAAVAVCDAFEPLPCRIKWPNDVWIDGRKLAGILVEGRPQEGWAVLGIGLNVTSAPPDLPATHLREHDSDATPQRALAELLAALEGRLAASPTEILEDWRARDALLGKEVRWDRGEGVAAGIDSSGALLVDTGEGRVALEAGEVHLSLPADRTL
jgi:BirA family transcriptional regulator, biotin operon repressor / biotin---[acetyl-CoA-carboxylase] ligase